jgi:hypothetical protein
MKIWTEYEILQIQAVLAMQFSKLEDLYKYVNSSKKWGEFTFYDVFKIKLQNIYDYVNQYGWDERVIKEVKKFPSENEIYEKGWIHVAFYIHPSRLHPNKWMRSSYADRGEIIAAEFDSLEAVKKEMVQRLMHIQWGYVNTDYRKKHYPNWTGSLSERFPPPPKWDD